MTAAASAAARSSSSGSVVPSRCGTSTTSSPNPAAYVFTTWRTCGFVASVTTILLRRSLLRDVARVGRDARPVVPDAFETSMPVSSQTAVWYSKIAWSTPWLISG